MSKVTKINREELKTLIVQRSGLSKEKTDIFLDAFKPSQVLKVAVNEV